jgi:hypothetical protein
MVRYFAVSSLFLRNFFLFYRLHIFHFSMPENEAVVAQLLRHAKSRHGLSHWPVIDDSEAVKREVEFKRKLRQDKQEAKKSVEVSDCAAAVAEVNPIKDEQSMTAPLEPCDYNVTSTSPESLGMVRYESFDDLPEDVKGRLKKSIFPPTSEEAAWMHLGQSISVI